MRYRWDSCNKETEGLVHTRSVMAFQMHSGASSIKLSSEVEMNLGVRAGIQLKRPEVLQAQGDAR